MKSPSGEAAPNKQAARGGAVIVAALVGIYMLSQFFRNALGVIGPDLARDFDLDAASLGLLSSIFFLSFALAQIPLGIAIDRWGPKPAMLAMAGLMIASSVLFALARDFGELTAARLLMGLGCCAFLMGPLALYAELFPPAKLSTIVGIHIGGGSVGMLAATAPLAALTATAGWRAAFLSAAGIAAVMTIGMALLVHEAPAAVARRRGRTETARETLAGVVAATRVAGFWPMFFMLGASYSAFAAVIGLWVGPWLAQTYGLSLEARGGLTLVMAIAQIAGLFLWGASDRLFGSYRWPVLLGIGVAIAALAVAALTPLPAWATPAFLAILGFALGISPILTAQGKSLFPPQLMGRGVTLLNMGTMGGAFAQQFLTGYAVQAFGFTIVDGARVYPPEAFRLVYGLIGVQLVAASLFYLRAPDAHPSRD
jgi:predicted MFS family arabinose efflux permease